MKVSVVVPCYNEEGNVQNIISAFRTLDLGEAELELILVQNGSKDRTAEMLEQYAAPLEFVQIVEVPVNQGYGFGVKQGLKAATGDYVGWLHADLQVAPEEMIPFIEKVQRFSSDEKIFCKGIRSNRNLMDHFFTFGMSVFETILYGTWLFDIGAIPVLFSRSLLSVADKAPNDFAIELFFYLMAKKNGFQVIRQKIHMRERKSGHSSWNNGLKSKFAQSGRIIKASFQIKSNL